MHVKSSEKASENLSQNNSAAAIHINRENIFYILEIIKNHDTEKLHLTWNF